MSKELEFIEIDEDFGGLEPFDHIAPEKNLLAAVLINALSDLGQKGPQRSQARRYFTNQSSDYIFSFRSVCDYLNIDPQLVLDHIRRQGLDR